ncbi:MAG: hypothetical protein IIC07_06200, partial [Proteobacteria bacterium]|nr:hypothetical protein [Pseudomonadota bacterium]
EAVRIRVKHLTIEESTQLLSKEASLLKQAEEDKCILLDALRLAVRYLEHPDVQSIPFALPASAPLERARAAIEKAER